MDDQKIVIIIYAAVVIWWLFRAWSWDHQIKKMKELLEWMKMALDRHDKRLDELDGGDFDDDDDEEEYE